MLHLSHDIQARLRCPICKGQLEVGPDFVLCTSGECGKRFPLVDGIPVLINEESSVFSIADFLEHKSTTFHLRSSRIDSLLQGALGLVPDINLSIGTERNYQALRERLLASVKAPKVLVIGGSIEGQGMKPMSDPAIELVGTDVSFGPLTALICDAHDIPFENETFDGVIAQAVLEHVVDPYRVVAEIHRVLKPGGFVYAETPFMQQVHMGSYDFTRFTCSGHRRLFRCFSEISGGPISGPGVALAWAYQYFLLSFSASKVLRGLLRAFSRLTSFYLKYLDYYLINKRAAIDASSGFFFMGQKDGKILSDRNLVKYYKGAASI
jgi:SAM-dependent methyltransferase/uncharacterized protein YbaR (Trm112 family)